MDDFTSDDELGRIFGGGNVRGKVSMLRPMEVPISTAFLQDLCREALARHRRHSPPTDEKKRLDHQRAIQQCIDFAAWLQSQSDAEIQMAIYPANEDGLDDEDLEELLDDLPEMP